MGYAILRTQKLKSVQEVRRSLKHALREQDTPNADPSRAAENTHIGAAEVAQALERFNARLPDKVRKNAVLAIEYLVTASPDDMRGKSRQEQDSYFEDALNWLERKHGKENVVHVSIHRDESTPHFHAYVVPIDENGKLNCRSFLGGSKALNQMQTDFAMQVGKRHGLQRGIEGSKARHTSIQQYYARANAELEPLPEVVTPQPKLRPEPMKPGIFASKDDKAFWENDHAAWERELVVFEKLVKQRKAEFKAMYDALEETARRNEVQAREAKALKIDFSKMKISNHYYVIKSSRLERENLELQKINQYFTPDEIKAREALHLQKKAEEAKAAGIESDLIKRLQDIQNLLKRGGVEYLFGMKALSALKDANDDLSKVDWASVEISVAREAIAKHGQTSDNIIKVILEHSPGCADPNMHKALQRAIHDIAWDLQDSYRPKRNQFNDPEQYAPR